MSRKGKAIDPIRGVVIRTKDAGSHPNEGSRNAVDCRQIFVVADFVN
jgi:hypothetical protein